MGKRVQAEARQSARLEVQRRMRSVQEVLRPCRQERPIVILQNPLLPTGGKLSAHTEKAQYDGATVVETATQRWEFDKRGEITCAEVPGARGNRILYTDLWRDNAFRYELNHDGHMIDHRLLSDKEHAECQKMTLSHLMSFV